MAANNRSKNLEERNVRETYRYLRIGLIGASALLATAVVIERFLAACWQGSISAYYYTPARGVFVGTLVAVGLILIVIKGTGWEDFFLNMAGMLAPVVAFVPTLNVGTCWSIQPEPPPLEGGGLAGWVVANIENNMWALIITGALGLVVAVVLFARTRESFLWPIELGRGGDLSAILGMILVALIIGGAAVALWQWDDFSRHAHNIAAIGMFVFLAAASVTNAIRTTSRRYRLTYWLVAILMVTSAPAIWLISNANPGWEHSILVLEAVEIALFTTYWIAQTGEHWRERVEPTAPAP